jgi:ATP-binding cassette subfamily B protein
VDGVDYWEFSAASWHRNLGVVEQEAFLFHDTLARNIAYGREQVTREQIEAAVRMAHLEDVVAELPEGLETIVGERGVLLSGGQRQRLAIARALVHNPRLLILDEATSALDNLAERQVQAALDRAVEGRTVLVIAHRLSTIRNADRIVVLEAGRVSEQGTWEELVKCGGKFSELLRNDWAGTGEPLVSPLPAIH